MIQGDLYYLLPTAEKFPHIQAMFPYMQGGNVLILKTKSTTMKSSSKTYYLKLVDFLYDGIVYTESFENLKKNSIYVGRKT
tara:strand:- start:1884 stop:2126 length:243 start_codon:yes stop_codon:yes gene_type:complete